MKVISLAEAEKKAVAMEGARNVWKQVPLGGGDGSPLFSFRVFTIEPHGHTPYHVHPFEHLNYVIEGNGALVMESGQEKNIHKGDFVLVLPHEKHRYRNTSDSEPLVMICAVPKEFE